MDSLENQLVEAIRNCKIDDVQSLLNKGVNVNYVPSNGKTPLSTAAALGNVALMQILLNANKSGDTFQGDRKQESNSKWISSLDVDKENKNSCVTYSNSTINQTSAEQKQNLGYYIFVHSDDPGGKDSFSEDMNKNESSDVETPEGMDGLEWDVEVEGEVVEDCDDVWASQFRWYADILDKTGGLVVDSVQGCDVNLQDYIGRCALHYAVEYCHVEAIHCLIRAGCRADIGDVDNLTPLHLAAMRDYQDIAELLIDRGCNVNSKTTDKMAPLHYAAVRGFVEMVALLIHRGALVDPLDANDRTPLMLAVTRNHLDVVEVLIIYGAKVNLEEIHGYTPLCEAVWNKSVEVAEVLLRAGAKLTQSQHLLHYSVLHRHTAMAQVLLSHGAYPNLRDDHGDTPLLLAIACCHIDMIKLLLQYEANPNSANVVTGVTPIYKALSADNHETLFEELLRLLCLHDVDLDMPYGEVYATPLMSALITGKFNCAALLIRAGADVNKRGSNTAMERLFPSTLDLAIRKEAHSLVHLIVAAGFDMSKYAVDFPKNFSEVNTESICGWLTYTKFNPRRLTDLCRLRIRSHMGTKALHLVPMLEIPQSLKKFLLFQGIYVKKYSNLPLEINRDTFFLWLGL